MKRKKNIQKSKQILIILVIISAVFAVAIFCPRFFNYCGYDIQFPSYDFPIDYTNLETVDPEEKVLFEGFRTSFIPDEERMLCQFHSESKREVSDDNNTSDIMFLWDLSEEKAAVSTRLKRESNTTSKEAVTRPRLKSAKGGEKNQNRSKSEDHDGDDDDDEDYFDGDDDDYKDRNDKGKESNHDKHCNHKGKENDVAEDDYYEGDDDEGKNYVEPGGPNYVIVPKSIAKHIRSDDDYNEPEYQDYDEPENQKNYNKNEDLERHIGSDDKTYNDYDEQEEDQDYDESESQLNYNEKEDLERHFGSDDDKTFNVYNQQEEYHDYGETENEQNYNEKGDLQRNLSKKVRLVSSKLNRESNSTSDNVHIGSDDKTYNDYDEQEEDQDYDESESQLNYNEKEDLESMVRPQTHVDRGPLDDVVEQVRGQPELEEGEMASAAHLYKPAKPHSGIHALFKGQGDKNTIRATQANIMRRNMDAEADPCQDFYQYACGNWAALNPIPADKAGYDTFEMLRENLDSVLKDLLEFIKDEQITSQYPGPHLEVKDNLIKDIITYQNPNDEELHPATLGKQTRDVLKSANVEKYRYYLKKSEQEKSDIINHIRHILYRKPRAAFKQLNDNSKKFYSKKRKPYQRRRRRLKQRGSVNKSFKYYPRRDFSLKRSKKTPDIVFRRSKIQAINAKSKKELKREAKHTKRETPSNKCGDQACGDAAMKAKFLFKSCMNYGILQKRGHQPLLDLLNLLGGWPILDPTWNKKDFDWLELMAKLRLYNNDILISEWVGPDIKNSDEFVIQFDQTSLGLPTREYFLQDSNKVYLDAYKNYLIKVALLLGGDKHYVEESAEKLIDFEIKLAKITSAPEDRRNVSELYRRMTLAKLETMVPQVNWRRYLCVVMNRTVRSSETVVLFALNYVRHLVTLINDTDPSILSNYLLWRFVRHRVNNLDDRFQSAKQQFYFILFGREQAPPRWKNCISQVNSNMGMALGSMFVKKYFDETSKNDTLTMTREIQQSFRELLHKITWIDDETKKLAAHKVDAMMLRIGYPDFILNKNQLNERYKEVKIHPDKYFENILNILQHLTQMEQSRIGQPVNKTLWNTAPAVVNAYYSRNKNQIMFPAGILQPPFYHRHFPRSLNYGGIGVVIGHEITHGFDDKGRLFDCNGNLHRWWSDTAIESFHRRAQCLIDQYGEYVVPEVNMKLDGVNTQGENIADNGGVKQAFRAYMHWVQQHGTEGETLPGLNHTHTQLFFLNFAQVWCGAMRPEAMRNKLKTAVHSPGRFRVIGTLSNSLDFAREFQCPPGTPMNPVHKCTVW